MTAPFPKSDLSTLFCYLFAQQIVEGLYLRTFATRLWL